MLWLKALHIIFMVTWFAGLFYLPRLFVYHAMSDDQVSLDRFKIMERKLFFGIMTPGAVLTLVCGGAMLWLGAWETYSASGWLHAKLLLIAILVVYHGYCAKLVADFKHDRNTRSHVYFRVFNEVPVLILVAIVLLASLKPF